MINNNKKRCRLLFDQIRNARLYDSIDPRTVFSNQVADVLDSEFRALKQ